MGIVRPKSGEQLTKQSIIDMHEEVRSKINDIKEDNLGRSSIGPQHLSTTPEDVFQSQNNTSFVMDFNETTTADTLFVQKMITVPTSASEFGGLNYQNQSTLTTEIGNWQEILSLTPLATQYFSNLQKEFDVIISFDSRVMNFTNSSKAAQTADENGMVWFAIKIDVDEITTAATTNNARVEEGSVVGTHLLDSNKFIKNSGTSGFAEEARLGGIEQSVSNTIRVNLGRKISSGKEVSYQINSIKLYAAYTTADSANKDTTAPLSNSVLLGNTTLRFFILKTPKLL